MSQAGNANYYDASAVAHIQVTSTPSAPTITSITNTGYYNGNIDITIAYTEPLITGNLPILNYQYVYSVDLSNIDQSSNYVTLDQSANPLIINNIFKPSKNYNIKIRAVNADGPGASSTTYSFIFNPPSAPTITKITTVLNNATIYYQPPANIGNSPITSYQYTTDGITYFSAGLSWTNSIEITNLTEIKTYLFQIRAVNAAGPGPASEIYPISNICFPAGTPIETNQGKVPIEKIDPLLHTIRNKKITHITKTITKDKYLVCIEKDALGKNIPSVETVISKNHRILYKGKMVKAKDIDNIRKVKYTGEVLYNILMEDNDKMVVNNLICETLDPSNSIAKLYKLLDTVSEEEKVEYIKELNNYIERTNVFKSKSK